MSALAANQIVLPEDKQARHREIHLEMNRLEREHGSLHAALDIISVEHDSVTGEPLTDTQA